MYEKQQDISVNKQQVGCDGIGTQRITLQYNAY